MKIAIIQMEVVAGDRQANYLGVRRLVEQALALDPAIDLLLLPELWSTGYALAELERLASSQGEDEAGFLGELAREYGIWFAGGSVAARVEQGIVNRAQIINRQGVLEAVYDKIHLVPMLDEPRYLVAGEQRLLHRIEGLNCGFAICYDIRFGPLLRRLALDGAQAMMVAAQWPLVRLSHWQTLLRARAIENQYYLLAANNCALGAPPFAGHSVAHGPDGSILWQAGFEPEIKVVTIQAEAVERVRQAVPVFADARPELYG
ncbi:nitrilase-related carbon-nitrogen hydrolase [Desulfogranum mediterraneum]|uniref:nitrilase-related carbon-nitrogen hydrolase n=1 Tax=Desulfogranum mediterraneum TaxID=160661 RepID=UPI000413EDDB|nr:nitrilase-related carbon-nitrogen hydrolase [Desulfogranum mediterraneum]